MSNYPVSRTSRFCTRLMWLFTVISLCMFVLLMQTHSPKALLYMGISAFLTWAFWQLS
jgi:hypothetical protein